MLESELVGRPLVRFREGGRYVGNPCLLVGGRFDSDQARLLKRQLSLPVSMMSQ